MLEVTFTPVQQVLLDMGKRGRGSLIDECFEGGRKFDDAKKPERFGRHFVYFRKISAKTAEILAKGVVKAAGPALEVGAIIGSADGSRNSKAVFSFSQDVTIFYDSDQVPNVGNKIKSGFIDM